MIVLCLSSTATCIVIVRVMNVWQNLSYFAGSNKPAKLLQQYVYLQEVILLGN